MLETALSAAKWLGDALLKKFSDDKTIKKQKRIQVAEHLETIATLIEESISVFDRSRIPYDKYAQLDQMRKDFGVVLRQIYDDSKPDDLERIHDCENALENVLKLINVTDDLLSEVRRLYGDGSNSGLPHTYIFNYMKDLQRTSGQFRGFAATVKALQ